MSTDSGIDLVAYSAAKKHPVTIQVKVNLKPKPGGGTGKDGLDWWVPENSPAELVALVDLSSERVWLMTLPQLKKYTQQNPERRLHIYMYTDSTAKPIESGRFLHDKEFEAFLLENRANKLFGV